MAQITATRAYRIDVPRPVRRILGRLDRRLRALALVRALGTAALIAALGMAVGMTADLVLGLHGIARWAVWIVWVLAIATPLTLALAKSLISKARALDLAAVLERVYPDLGERLTGAVGLLGEGDGPAHGSPELIAALADDASALAGSLDPNRAAPAKSPWRRLAVGLLALALVAAPAVVQPDPFGKLARRFLTPWVGVDRVGLYTVTVAPGDAVVALGDDFTVDARVAPRFGQSPVVGGAWLEWSEVATGRVRRIAMTEREANKGGSESASDPRGFAIVLPRVAGTLTYRVVSRSGESRRFRVEAVAPPAISALKARVEPPAYTRLPAAPARDPARIEAWEGSRVVLTLAASTPIRSAEVSWPRETPEGSKPEPRRVKAEVAADGRSATALVPADVSGEYTVALRDTHGLASRPEPPRRVVVRPDAPPLVAVRGVEGLDTARADDTLRVGIAARDDLAVASADLYYTIDRASGGSTSDVPPGDSGHVAAPLAGLGTRSARGEAALGLKALGIKPGDVVVYRARVTDNRPAPRGPNVTWSGPKRLTIVEKAEPLAERRDRIGREEIQAKLEALKKAAAENRHETELLRYAADAVQRGNGDWDRDRRQALAHREAEARAVADGLQKLAVDLTDSPAFRPLARPARQAAEVEAEAARATLDQARQADAAARRLADLRQADSRLAAVSDRIEELQRGLNALTERAADRRRLQALADRQARAANEADDAGAADRARLDKADADQKAVQKDLDELLRKSPELRADVLAAQADEAEDLAHRARAVAERQRAEARTATDLSKKAATLKALAEEQRAIEDDARRLALDVNTPLAEAGRNGLNTDPVRQAIEPIERGDLDQGRHQLNGAENELRRLARDLEDAPGDIKALARRLAQRQERLVNDEVAALGEHRNKTDVPAADRAALAGELKPIAEGQKAIADLAAAILKSKDAQGDSPAEAKFPREAAEKAASATARAAEAVAAAENPREAEKQAHAARDALYRLANELPDAWRRNAPVQRALSEAKRTADEAANEAEKHLRETEHRNDRDPAATAAELARRLEPVAEKARKAADRLAAIEPGARLAPQRDRAARRARALADAVEAARAPDQPANADRARRDAVAAAAVATRAAAERLEQKFHGNIPADDVAAELADEQRALAPGEAPADPNAEGADEQRRLAAALRGLKVPDAALEQAEAVRLAEQAARDGKADARARAAEAAEALADRLADRQTPRGRVEALARAERALNDPAAPPDPDAEAARQRAVAAELSRLNAADRDANKEANQAAIDAVRHAGDLAEQTLHPGREPNEPGKSGPAQQAEARAQAAAALDALAARLPGEQDSKEKGQDKDKENGNNEAGKALTDPELAIDPGQAAKALELAKRERRVKERLQAVLGEHVAPQQDVRREAVEVGRELADLRDRTRGISDRAAGPANEAAAYLGKHAPQAMDEAADRLAQGQTAPARDTQRRATELADRGAQNAEDLAAALRAESAMPPNAAGAAHPGPLAEAREAVHQAGKQLGQARGAAAADQAALNAARQAMHAAAERLQAAASAKGQAQGQDQPGDEPGEANASTDNPSNAEPKSDSAGVAEPTTLAELQERIRTTTGRRWGELPGHLRSEILQMSQGRYRDDYARLIQLYFREIAAGAGTKQDANP